MNCSNIETGHLKPKSSFDVSKMQNCEKISETRVLSICVVVYKIYESDDFNETFEDP